MIDYPYRFTVTVSTIANSVRKEFQEQRNENSLVNRVESKKRNGAR